MHGKEILHFLHRQNINFISKLTAHTYRKLKQLSSSTCLVAKLASYHRYIMKSIPSISVFFFDRETLSFFLEFLIFSLNYC